MCSKEVIINNQIGNRARPATFFIQKANEFKSSIWVEKEERRVNAKSLLGVLSLGIMGDTEIRIIAGGVDEEQAVNALVAKFKDMIEGNATLTNVEEWGKRKLAYPIDFKTEGYYVLVNFASAPEFPKELERIYGITDGVMRTITIRKEA